MARLSSGLCAPWMVLGDFNTVILAEEKKGGGPVNTGYCAEFRRSIEQARLLDLGCKGCSFTWNRGSVYKCLDRVLCNSDWRLQWHQAEMHHLPRTKSDHCPILVQMEERNRMRFKKPFRFHMAWLTHKSFSEMVVQNWLADHELPETIEFFTEKLEMWNKSMFGNVFFRKK